MISEENSLRKKAAGLSADKIRKQMENIYSSLSPEDIPWNQPGPSRELKRLISSGMVKPCKAIDLGCGTGSNAIYLAKKGFDMTGVDICTKAIEIAKAKAAQKAVTCDFLVCDLLGRPVISDAFDFAYDWELLHHIFPDQRARYAKNVHGFLNTGGKYLSICFSEDDPQFNSMQKFRKTKIGTILYFSSEEEIKSLFEPYFEIIDLKTIEVSGKRGRHIAVYAFMEKTHR